MFLSARYSACLLLAVLVVSTQCKEVVHGSAVNRDDVVFRSMNGPSGGLCLGMSTDPVDSNRLMVSTEAAIYHSVNGGRTWMPGQSLQVFSPLSHFRRHPLIPGIILATGSDSVNDERCDIFRSIDNGLTWTAFNMTDSFHDIWIHESEPDRYIAGNESGILLSTDAGDTWSFRNIEAEIYEFASDPEDPDTLYAAIDSTGIAISRDGGASWMIRQPEEEELLPGELRDDRTTCGRSIAVARCSDLTIYTSYRFNHSGYVDKSMDEGLTWETILDAPINCVRVDPSNPDILWATGGKYDWDPIEVYQSVDRGDTWVQLDIPFSAMGWYIYFDPSNSNIVYISKVIDGLIKTDDGGVSWASANRYISSSWVSSITLNEVDETTMIVGSRDTEDMFFTDKWGREWVRIDSVDGSYSSAAAYKPDDVNTILAGARTVSRSTDGGETFLPTNCNGQARIQKIRYCHSAPDYVYAGKIEYTDSNGVYFSQNGGEYWSRVSTHNIATLEADPFDPAIVFIHSYIGPNNSFLRSDDYGLTWTSMPLLAWGIIAADPITPGRYYIQEQPRGIARTDDWGDTWTTDMGTEITETLYDMQVSPVDGRVYSAGEGLWVSDDQGQTWNRFIQGLKTQLSKRVAIREEDGEETVYLGTTQSGLYRLTSPDIIEPECQILDPSEGDVLYYGDTVDIEWIAMDNEVVLYTDLFLSTDSGQTWPIVIMGGLLENGHYTWSIPMIPSTTCRIKVVVYDPSWNQASDSSSGDFTIIAPTPTPSPTPTVTPTPSKTPTATLTPSPTDVPTSTPGTLNIDLRVPAPQVAAGEIFYLDAVIRNPADPIPWAPVFIALEIEEEFWLAPGWHHYEEMMDHYTFSLPVSIQSYPIIPAFQWPDVPVYGIEALFIGFITDPGISHIISNIDVEGVSF